MEKSITKERGMERPPEVAVSYHFGVPQYTVNVLVEERAPAAEGQPQEYGWTCICLSPGPLTYDALVAALIRTRYSDDRMASVINNRMAEPDDADIAAEWEEMQQWRREAKALAKQILTDYNDNGNG